VRSRDRRGRRRRGDGERGTPRAPGADRPHPAREARSRVLEDCMATELQQMIDVVAKDKGIDPSVVITAIEDAYLAASRKVFKSDEDLRTRFNLESGKVELYAVRQIVP